MLYGQLRDEWQALELATPISAVLNFAPAGLVLGTGTVLLCADGPRRLQSPAGRERGCWRYCRPLRQSGRAFCAGQH
jgi:hypothetical protein